MDEEKALRLRRNQLEAELARINALLDGDAPPQPKPGGYPASEADFVKNWVPKSAQGTSREQFYKDAENDFRNVDSNGNYQ
jgi:hypothetical protein